MNFKKDKLDNLKNNHLLFSIFLIILVITLITSVSASDSFDMNEYNSNTILESNNVLNIANDINNDNTLKLQTQDKSEKDVLSTNSVHIISCDASNDRIQSIFDNSKSGDTIEFNDREYHNVSIVVNKKLNIVSKGNSVIHTSDSKSARANEMGLSNSFGFYFTKLASGSVIKGLTLTGNSDYEIMVDGASNIRIVNNRISGGNKSGIYLKNSKSDIIEKNIISNANDGIICNNVGRTKIIYNRIQQNRNTGMVLENVNGNNITKNLVTKNGLDGVLLKNAESNSILRNNITKNGVSGLRMEGFTTKNVIMYNNISSNVVNVFANSLSNKDKMTKNTLMFARKVYGTYLEDENAGAAIFFGDDYRSVAWGNLDFSYNSIGMNEVWDAKSTMSHPPVKIGANWYFDNDGNFAIGHICPMVFGKAITADELKTLSMGFSSDGKGIFGQLYDGKTPAEAGSFKIDNVIVDGKDYGSVEVGEDGRFDLDLSSLPAGSVVTINISGHVFNITIDDELDKRSSSDSKGDSNNVKEDDSKSAKDDSGTEAFGNGTGSGSGSSTGSGSGEGNFSGSGISVGDLSGQSNQGTGDAGENGGGSASEGANAYEILREQNTPAAAKNSQLIAVFAVALVILIIALGYRSKNKDEYNDNGDYSL
jgi:parallel beta-helix repeat protein